jgi:hypothetical protein
LTALGRSRIRAEIQAGTWGIDGSLEGPGGGVFKTFQRFYIDAIEIPTGMADWETFAGSFEIVFTEIGTDPNAEWVWVVITVKNRTSVESATNLPGVSRLPYGSWIARQWLLNNQLPAKRLLNALGLARDLWQIGRWFEKFFCDSACAERRIQKQINDHELRQPRFPWIQ